MHGAAWYPQSNGPCPADVPSTTLIPHVSDADANLALSSGEPQIKKGAEEDDQSEVSTTSYGTQKLSNAYDGTTLVLRNVCNRCSIERLLQLWPPYGTYNYMFRPYRANQRRPTKYVFINFLCEMAAVMFREQWHNRLVPEVAPRVALFVGTAHIQGLQANIQLHRGSLSFPKARVQRAFENLRVFDDFMQPVDFLALLDRMSDGRI